MVTGDMGAPTKITKTSTPQEQHSPSSTPMSYPPDWMAAYQAYYGPNSTPMPPPAFFPTVGSGPQPHPYMWGAQPLVAPYGTPPPFAALYAHGGAYAHHSVPPGAHPYSPYGILAGITNKVPGNVTPVTGDVEGKSEDGSKSKSATKKVKGSLGSLLSSKVNEADKGTPCSRDGALSHSHDSGSEVSTDGSEENSHYGSDEGGRGGLDQDMLEANVAPYRNGQEPNHGSSMPAIPMAGKQVVGAGPLTNLNIGMDYWNGGAPALLASNQGKRTSLNSAAIVPSSMAPGRDGVSGELWLQDERELKRQRRKQSNRESARRSRMRKQAECEELAAKVMTLTTENSSLRSELSCMHEQYSKLSAENSSLMEQLQILGIQPERIVDRNGTNISRAERKGTSKC